MDIGYWIRSFQTHYLRAKGLSGYLCHWYIHKLFTGIIFKYERLLLLEDEAYIIQVDMISTGRYYDDVDIIQWNSYSRLVTYTSHVNKTISSSDVAITNVCIY